MTERALRAGVENLDVGALFDDVRLGLAIVGSDGAYLSVNPGLARFLGTSVDELLDADPKLLLGEDLEPLLEDAGRRSESYTNRVAVEIDESPVWLEIRAGKIRDRTGRVAALVCLVTDASAVVAAEERLRRSQRQLRLILESSNDLVMVLDRDGDVRFTSPSEERILGEPRENRLGRSFFELVPDRDRAHVLAVLDRVCAEAGADQPVSVDLRHADGSFRRFTGKMVNRIGEGGVDGVVVTLRDAATEHLGDAAASGREQRFRQLVDDSPLATLVAADGQVLFANHAAAQLFEGEHADDLVGHQLTEWLPPEAVADLDAALDSGARDSGTQEIRIVRPDGSISGVATVARRVDFGGRSALHLVAWDITEQKRTEADLVYQAAHDALTGLPNRYLLTDRIERSLARRLRDGGETAVMLVDLDRFKEINDNLGHAAGDAALLAVAHRLERVVRPTDSVARLGGDEFVIVCEIGQSEEAAMIADRVVRTLERPIAVEGTEVVTGASVGVAVTGDAQADPEDLLRAADRAMFAAKERGRGRWERSTSLPAPAADEIGRSSEPAT